MNKKFHSEETKEKIRKAHLGKSLSQEAKRKISLSLLNQFGEKNRAWKGNKASYRAIHRWVRTYKPKAEICECGKHCDGKGKPEEISLIGKKCTRNFEDYEWRCKRCHRIEDGAHLNLKAHNKKVREKLKPLIIKADYLRDKGFKNDEIAKKLGVSKKTITYWLNNPLNKEFGIQIKIKKGSKEYQEKIDKAIELRKKGENYTQIAKEVKVSRQTIARWLS